MAQQGVAVWAEVPGHIEALEAEGQPGEGDAEERDAEAAAEGPGEGRGGGLDPGGHVMLAMGTGEDHRAPTQVKTGWKA